MARLLVSVRDAREARIALSAGVDLVDIKEPSRGSLGAADVSVVREVVCTVDGAVPLSMALGELTQWEPSIAADIPAGIQYVKLGLAGCAGLARWPFRWQQALGAIRSGIVRVAVVYADWHTAGSPEPRETLRLATELGCGALLVDTFDKASGGLFRWWPWEELEEFVGCVKHHGLLAVVAGSVTLADLPRLLAIAPDYVAVRGAACRGGRAGRLDTRRTGRLVRALAGTDVHARTPDT